MPSIDVDSLQDGMKIAADVVNLHGQLILKKGVSIEEKHMRILKAWGVQTVEVESAGGTHAQAESANSLSEEQMGLIEEALTDVFGKENLQQPLMKQLYQVCLARKAKRVRLAGASLK